MPIIDGNQSYPSITVMGEGGDDFQDIPTPPIEPPNNYIIGMDTRLVNITTPE